jgi:EmrB/QacA subfamily drug resistance transporter
MIGTFMSVLDSSIVNVSIPNIMADFGSNINDIQWVVTAYMLAFAVLMPLTAWLKDLIGYRRLYVLSVAVFTLGSILCGVAWNVPSLIFARVIQALGGGAINPIGMAMVADVFEPKERGKAMGLWGAGVILGPVIGPTLGGYLTYVFGWRSIFLINLPVGIICVILALERLLNDKPKIEQLPHFDFGGFISLSVFLVSFLYGITKGEQDGWGSPAIFAYMVTAIVSLISFLIIESLSDKKIIDLGLLRYPVFSIALLVSAIRSMALFGGIFLLPLFLQQLKGYDAIQTGLMMLPSALFMMFLMPLVGRFSDRASPRFLTLLGMILMAWSMYMFCSISIYMSVWDIILPTMIRSIGFSLLMAPIMTLIVNSVPRDKISMASSMSNIVQQVSGAVGIAFLSTILSSRIKFHMANIGQLMHNGAPVLTGVMRQLQTQAHNIGYSHVDAAKIAQGALYKHVYIAQANFAFQDAFLAATIMIGIAVLPVYFLPKHNNIGHEKPTIMAE